MVAEARNYDALYCSLIPFVTYLFEFVCDERLADC
jgi:hypothetical protein